ncbi:MAG: pilus assembly protein PilM [Deltaproteobacteria bacterium]|nr:pilus assembly protein PilM [Deltaproteobacteria bacterium]
MANIFGIDIGRYSLKVVNVKTTLRGIEYTGAKEFVFPRDTGLGSEENVESLKEFFTIEGLSASEVIVGIPSDMVSVHTISVPFTDDKLVSQAIGTELEGVSPFSLEETIMDYNVLRKDRSGEQASTQAITFSMNTDTMKQWLDLLMRIGVDPNIIEVAHSSYANLSAYLKLEGPFVIVDIGHMHTSLTFINDSGVFMARDLRISAPMLGLVPGADTLNESIKAFFVKELKLSISTVERKIGADIASVVFAGRLADKGRVFEKDLGLPVFSLPINDIARTLMDERASIGPEYGLACALALRNVIRKPRNLINLRRGSFKFQRAIEQIKGKLVATLGIAGLIIIVSMVSMAYGYIGLKHRSGLLEKKMYALFHDAFPNEPSLGDPLGTMKYLVSQEKKKSEDLSGSIPVIEVLRELSTGIPKDVKVDVTELSIDPEQITLRGRTPTIDNVDKIVIGIKNFNTIKDVKVIDTRKTADQKAFEFQLGINLK